MTSSSDFRVTLLGTGVPTPRPDRFGPSTLVEVGNQRLLIDAGRGAAIRLYQVGVPMGSIDALHKQLTESRIGSRVALGVIRHTEKLALAIVPGESQWRGD